MRTTTKVAVLVEQGHDLEIMEIELPKLGVGQVLADIEYTGVCGKQVEEIDGHRGPDPHLPHLLGHEAGGVILETGPGVKKVAPGFLSEFSVSSNSECFDALL